MLYYLHGKRKNPRTGRQARPTTGRDELPDADAARVLGRALFGLLQETAVVKIVVAFRHDYFLWDSARLR